MTRSQERRLAAIEARIGVLSREIGSLRHQRARLVDPEGYRAKQSKAGKAAVASRVAKYGSDNLTRWARMGRRRPQNPPGGDSSPAPEGSEPAP